MPRTFIAIELDSSTHRALGAFISRRPLRGPGIRWVRSESIHLTLKFLGDVEEQALDNVTRAVLDASRRVDAFEVQVRGVGFFPGPSNPRVFWAGTAPCAALTMLAREIEAAMAALGFPRERRGFRAHLTLARLKGARHEDASPGGGSPNGGAAGGVRGLVIDPDLGPDHPVFGAVEVKEVLVMQSVLGAGGPHYTRLATAALADQD